MIHSTRETCPTCGGSKHRECPTCHGQKRVPCSSCNGTGKMGFSIGGFQQQSDCFACGGKKTVECLTCGGRGQLDCITCFGTGTVERFVVEPFIRDEKPHIQIPTVNTDRMFSRNKVFPHVMSPREYIASSKKEPLTQGLSDQMSPSPGKTTTESTSAVAQSQQPSQATPTIRDAQPLASQTNNTAAFAFLFMFAILILFGAASKFGIEATLVAATSFFVIAGLVVFRMDKLLGKDQGSARLETMRVILCTGAGICLGLIAAMVVLTTPQGRALVTWVWESTTKALVAAMGSLLTGWAMGGILGRLGQWLSDLF